MLVGGATFRNWPHPSLPDDADRRIGHRPWNVIVTRSFDVPLSEGFLAEPAIRPLVLTRASSFAAGRAPGGAEVESWAGEGSDLPVAWMLERLAARGIELGDPGILVDIDTPADLDAVRQRLGGAEADSAVISLRP